MQRGCKRLHQSAHSLQRLVCTLCRPVCLASLPLLQRACRHIFANPPNFCKDETPGPKLCGSHGVRRPTDSRRPVHCCSCSDVVWPPASLGLCWRASVLKATQLMEGRFSELLVVGKLTTSRPRGHSGPQLARPPAPCPWHCVRPSN